MSNFAGVVVSDQWLQSQFTQVELRSLKSKVTHHAPFVSILFIFFNLFVYFYVYVLFLCGFSSFQRGLRKAVLPSETCLLFL